MNCETMPMAEMVVHLILDAVGDDVEVEYHPSTIDSMPHTTWLIRAVGAEPSQFLARGTAHSPQDAERQVAEKTRILGTRIAKVNDFRKRPNESR